MMSSASRRMFAIVVAVVVNVGAVHPDEQSAVVALKDLKRHVGQEVLACGRLVLYECDDATGELWLFLDKPDGRTAIAVPREYWPDSRGRTLTDQAMRSTICARGTVQKKKDGYHVTVHTANQIDVRDPAAPAAPPFAPTALHTCALGVSPPKLLREVKPSYTSDAMRALERGKMYLEAEVLADGSVGDVRELTTLSYGLGKQAIAALEQWRFAPATLGGRGVPVVVIVEMTFTLR